MHVLRTNIFIFACCLALQEGLTFWYHIPTGQSQWTQPTSDHLETDASAAAAASGAVAGALGALASAFGQQVSPARSPVDPVQAAIADAEHERIGMLERFHDPKGVLKPGGFRKHFFELRDGHLSAYENEESYRKGASVKAGHDLDMSKYILLEALAVVGIGPSHAAVANPADEGKTLTLQAVDIAATQPPIWQVRCPTVEVRNAWGLSLLASGAARPALQSELEQ